MHSRDERISELLQQQLCELLREVKDPGLMGLVTVTGLDLSKDRKTAQVFISVMGTGEERASALKALERASQFLRRKLRQGLKLKLIPRLEFLYDHTPERADRIERILNRIEEERRG